jgi:hypothetical protein
MKLTEYFTEFLRNTVNLDDTRLGRLNKSVEALTGFLQASATFSEHFIDTIPQGSYAHKTIIKPVRANDEFDADLLLFLEEVEGWEPSDYVLNLFSCFKGSGVYKDKAECGKRCVTIDYAGDFHVDVVPYLERGGRKYITNCKTNAYELTDPEKYNAWLEEKNRIAKGHLVKVIRLVKYLRDYKGTFDVKSVVLNVLLGEWVNEVALLGDPECYADVPTTLRSVMNRLSQWLAMNPYLPAIMDPGETGENFSLRWDQAGYSRFREAAIRYAEWIDDAWTEPDPALSLMKWQRVFGDDFQPPKSAEASAALVRQSTNLPVPYRNTEQSLRDLGISSQIVPRYRFRITGKVLKADRMGAYYLKDRGNKVLKGRKIRFAIAECNVPEPFKIYWKVTNRGQEARERDCIRGQIIEGQRVWGTDESTDFDGPHFVDCFIVKNGICVARDRQEVIII